MEKKPYIEPSDMFKAFNLLQQNIDEWIEAIDEKQMLFKNRHFPLRREQVKLSYSPQAQALRIEIPDYDMCITAKYNVWNEELEDFTDRVYFRKYSETQKVGDGVLGQECEADGAIFDGKAFMNRGNIDVYDLFTTNEQSEIWNEFAPQLMFMHHDENSGIVCTHEDDPRLLRSTRFGDYDSLPEW